jgi:hypothetical protein
MKLLDLANLFGKKINGQLFLHMNDLKIKYFFDFDTLLSNGFFELNTKRIVKSHYMTKNVAVINSC